MNKKWKMFIYLSITYRKQSWILFHLEYISLGNQSSQIIFDIVLLKIERASKIPINYKKTIFFSFSQKNTYFIILHKITNRWHFIVQDIIFSTNVPLIVPKVPFWNNILKAAIFPECNHVQIVVEIWRTYTWCLKQDYVSVMWLKFAYKLST